MRICSISVRRFTSRILLTTIMAAFLSTMIAFAQNQAAQVSGLITDTSGAVIPNAVVEVLSNDTGVSHHTESNGEGYYVVPLLQPGTYKMTATCKAFL